MPKKISVAILGSSGFIGQQYNSLLKNHPQFEVDFMPNRHNLLNFKEAKNCRLIFSGLPSEVAQTVEPEYAKRGFAVFSSASCHRLDKDIPLIIPEINSHHLDLIKKQKKNRGWNGCIVSKPNCTLQSYLLPLFPLHKSYHIDSISVTNLQATSGGGKNCFLNDNIIPFIKNEEEKSEMEPKKILDQDVKISSQCLRVPVNIGHLSCISASFKSKPVLAEIKNLWSAFRGVESHSAPSKPLIYFEEDHKPQPKKDIFYGRGMTVAIGRLRKCSLFNIKFIALSNNLVRGGAGGGILTAEIYVNRYEKT